MTKAELYKDLWLLRSNKTKSPSDKSALAQIEFAEVVPLVQKYTLSA